MKILLIPQTYPDEQNRKITPFIRENAQLLVSLGHDIGVLHVKLLPLKRWLKHNTSRISRIEEDGLTRYARCMRYVHSMEKLNTWIFCKRVRKLFHLYCIKNGKPDIIISHFYQYAGYAAAKITKEQEIPLIHVEHAGWLLDGSIAPFEIEKLGCVLANADKFVCVSEMLKKALEKAVGKSSKMVVIPNTISDCFRYSEPVKKEKYVFFSAGNLYEGKRFPLLIEAFCVAFSVNDEVELRIAGVGHMDKQMIKLISDNRREHQIKMLGGLDKHQMLDEYNYCDCFVLPSEHETFGIVYREAMACGRPIITTDHQGFVGDWSDEYGIKIPIDDRQALIQALKYMKTEGKRFDGQKISKDCVQKYAHENVVGMYEGLLNTVCAAGVMRDDRQ